MTFAEPVLSPTDGTARAFTTDTADGYGTTRIEIRSRNGYAYLWVQAVTNHRTDPGGKARPFERCYPLSRVGWFDELR